MSKFPLLTYPAKELTIPSTDVTDFAAIKEPLYEMKTLCKAVHGLGIAAPQVGIHQRFFIMDLSRMVNNDDKAPIITIVNPIIKDKHELIKIEEGCLSLPGVKIVKERYREIELHYYDENAEFKKAVFTDGEAVCCQHEIDHLDGKLLWDGLSNLKKNWYKTKTIKYQRKCLRGY